jgi:hypothetical protein
MERAEPVLACGGDGIGGGEPLALSGALAAAAQQLSSIESEVTD